MPNHPIHPSRRGALVAFATASAALAFPAARALADPEKVSYLLAAPFTVLAFAHYQLALAKGYYRAENLDVAFTTVNGGAEVAKQVGAGNGDMGGGIGDTPIIVRANGVPVRDVAILGGRSLAKIALRTDRGLGSIKDLRGKTVTVLSFTDTTYYALLGSLSKVGLTKNDVNIQAAGGVGMEQLLVAGKADAMCGVPEHVVSVQAAGAPVTVVSCDRYFPSMAQAILASDQTIAKRPAVVRSFVRATLRALRDIMADPDRAAADYVAAVPAHRGEDALVAKVLTSYARDVFPGQRHLGEIDASRLAAVAAFYVEAGIVENAVPVASLYTNAFIG